MTYTSDLPPCDTFTSTGTGVSNHFEHECDVLALGLAGMKKLPKFLRWSQNCYAKGASKRGSGRSALSRG